MRLFRYFLVGLVSSIWIVTDSPVFPLGAVICTFFISRFEKNRVIIILITIICTILGFFNNGAFIKLNDGEITAGFKVNVLLGGDVGSNMEIDGVDWGLPAEDKSFMERSFVVEAYRYPGSEIIFPVDIEFSDGLTIRSHAEIGFGDGFVILSNICSLYNSAYELLDHNVAEINVTAKRTGNTYYIAEDVEREVAMDRRNCAVRMHSGTYSLFREGDEFRFFTSSPDYYMILK